MLRQRAKARSRGEEKRVLDFIVVFQEQHSYPPTIRQIMRATRERSTSSVYRCLLRLVREGCLAPRESSRQLWRVLAGETTGDR